MQLTDHKLANKKEIVELWDTIQEIVKSSTDVLDRVDGKMDLNAWPEDNNDESFFISVWNITDDEIIKIHQLLCMANVQPVVYFGDMYSSTYPEYINEKGEKVRNDVLLFQYGPFVTEGWQIVVPYKLKGKIPNAHESD